MIPALTGPASPPPPTLRRASSAPGIRPVEPVLRATRERPPPEEQEPSVSVPVSRRAASAPPAAALEPVSTQTVLHMRSTGASVVGIAEAYGLSAAKVRELLGDAGSGA